MTLASPQVGLVVEVSFCVMRVYLPSHLAFRITVDIRDFFEPGGSDRVLHLLRKYAQTGSVDHSALLAVLSLARTAAKSENNKCTSSHDDPII
jgi:hypothetical protein